MQAGVDSGVTVSRYRIASVFAAEIRYVQAMPKIWLRSDEKDWPIEKLVAEQMPPGLAGIVTHHGCDLEQRDVIDALMEHEIPACNVKGFEASFSAGEAALETIWKTHFDSVPPEIYVHLTNYGRGGSYHPIGQHPITELFRGPAISVKPQARKEQPLFILAHETVHLAINDAVEDRFGSEKSGLELYRVKEAIVDKVLSAEEFSTVGGPFHRWPDFINDLPGDWVSLPCFTKPFTFKN